MNRYRNLLIVVTAIFLTACGGGSETAAPAGPGEPNESQSAAVVEQQQAEELTEESANLAVLEAVEESASDVVADEVEAEETIVLAEAAPESEVSAPKRWKYSPEKHFTILTTAQGTSSSPDLVEVTEVFWYGCPHCYSFDPYLEKWKEGLPDDVNFVRLPVMWNPTNQIHARIFYTAEALGKLDEVHEAVFLAMHRDKKTLSTEASIQEFLLQFGISEQEFNDTFRSFAVESKLQRAKNLTERYRIQSVPLLVTNGKYLTQGSEIQDFDEMLAVTDELIERERQEL
jgi:thiol:disulfide interchange protein DsbA